MTRLPTIGMTLFESNKRIGIHHEILNVSLSADATRPWAGGCAIRTGHNAQVMTAKAASELDEQGRFVVHIPYSKKAKAARRAQKRFMERKK